MLILVPTSFRQACDFVASHHRHHQPPVGHKFSIGIEDSAHALRGVVIIGRPVSRHCDDGSTLEVTRCCTDGVPNGCSMLYGAAWRAARSMGFIRMITYTLPGESGTSPIAAGWELVGETAGGSWDRKARPRQLEMNVGVKIRWEILAQKKRPC